MTKQLIIRLSGQANGNIPWLVWQHDSEALDGGKIVAQGVLDHAEQLHELVHYADDAELTVLVSSTEVGFHLLELPPGSRRHLAQVVPYALEEELAQDIHEVHFAWQLNVPKNQPLPVAVVAKTQVQAWQAWLEEAGLAHKALIPDLFILPLADDEWSVMSMDDDIVVRHQAWRGFAIEQSLFEELAGLFSDALPPPSRIRCWGSVEWPQAPAALALADDSSVPGNVTAAQDNSALALARHLSANKTINLLQGDFAVKTKRGPRLGIWRWPGIAAAILLGLLFFDKGTQLWQLNQQQRQVGAAIEERYRAAFPQDSRIVNVRAQLNQHLNSLQSTGNESQILVMLQQLAPAFNGTNLEINLMQFDASRAELRIQASGDDFVSFERFQQLARERALEIEQGQLNSRSGRIAGTLIVRGSDGG